MPLELRSRSMGCAVGAVVLALIPGCMLQDFDELGSGLGAGAGGAAGAQTGVGQGGNAQGGSSGTGGASAAGSAGAAGASGASGVGEGNLIPNPSFEAGHADWVGFGGSTILDWSMAARTGNKCIASQSRTETWQGPSYNVLPLVTVGDTYDFSGWVRMEEGLEPVTMTLKSACSAVEATYTTLGSVIVDTEWTLVSGLITVPDCGLSELTPYFEGPAQNAVFFVDDVSLTLVP
jgi:Carbohydrate binding domain